MDQGIDLFEECYYVNPFFFNIPRIGSFLIVRYACDWKLVTLEGEYLYVAALVEGVRSHEPGTTPPVHSMSSPTPSTRVPQRYQRHRPR